MRDRIVGLLHETIKATPPPRVSFFEACERTLAALDTFAARMTADLAAREECPIEAAGDAWRGAVS